MIPQTRQALLDLALKLAIDVGPHASNEFAATNTALIAMLLQLFAEECERGVETRHQDIQELKDLLRHSTPPPQLAPRVEVFLQKDAPSLTLTDQNALLDEGLTLLIEFHRLVEQDPSRSEENAAIWEYLHNFASRHSYAVAM